MNNDELPDGEPPPASCYPTRAKDMFGVGERIIRNLLENGCFDELYEIYGITRDEAALSLHCAEIASWPWWDLEAIVEAGTVYQTSRLKLYEGSEGCEAEIAAILDGITRIKRRVHLAAKEPNFPEVSQAGEAVLFLESIDVDVFYELRDAVISRLAGQEVMSQENWNLLRRLLGKEVQAESADAAPVDPSLTKYRRSWDEAALKQLLREYKEMDLTQEALAKKYGATRQFIAKMLKKAEENFGTKKANAFSPLWKGRN